MKRSLLILFALPFLLNAQSVTVNTVKEGLFFKQMIKSRQAENGLFTYSTSADNLPDSIYTYEGEEKRLYSKAAFTYDDTGRVLQEKGIEQLNNGEDSGREYKIDYAYTQENDLLKTEEIKSVLVNGNWVYYTKLITVVNSKNALFSAEMHEFDPDADSWVLFYKYTPVEFDDSNRPIAFSDSVIEDWTSKIDTAVHRIEVSYNELGQVAWNTLFWMNSPVFVEVDEWVPVQRWVYTYNEDNMPLKVDHYDYDYYDRVEDVEWVYELTIEREFDDNGNMLSEVYYDERGVRGATYCTYTYSTPNANEVFFSVESDIYPNPVSDVLFVRVEGTDNAVIILVNITGGIVAQQTTSGAVTEFPVQSLAKGNYFLIVKTDRGVKTHKVIIK